MGSTDVRLTLQNCGNYQRNKRQVNDELDQHTVNKRSVKSVNLV